MPSPGPRVSIVIPVYNGANFLREAVESALAQSHRNLEVLVVNDGSTDGGETEAIAKSYGERIRYLSKPNGGVASALNTGIREMSGEYFSWLSHDDLYLPTKIEAEIARSASARPGSVVFCDFETFDLAGRTVRRNLYRGRTAAIRVEMVVGDPINGCSVLVPRTCFDRVGLFDERLRTIQDYDMWFRLAKHFPFEHVAEVLVRSRTHPAQGTRTITTFSAEMVRELCRFAAELGEEDLRSVDARSPSAFFAGVALRQKLRGLDDAAFAALELARVRGAADPSLERLRVNAAAVACKVLTRKMKPGYWVRRLRARGLAPRP